MARMFDRFPSIGEDPATGSAAGPLGAYLAVAQPRRDPGHVAIAQGERIRRPSVLYVDVAGDGGAWRIDVGGGVRSSGRAVRALALTCLAPHARLRGGAHAAGRHRLHDVRALVGSSGTSDRDPRCRRSPGCSGLGVDWHEDVPRGLPEFVTSVSKTVVPFYSAGLAADGCLIRHHETWAVSILRRRSPRHDEELGRRPTASATRTAGAVGPRSSSRLSFIGATAYRLGAPSTPVGWAPRGVAQPG